MRSNGLSARFALIAVALGVAVPAAAEETDGSRGRLHFQAGASYFEAGDYEDALREFERAYELSGRPELFYNFALCHQYLGHYAQAADFMRRYLAEVEVVPNRSNLERRLEKLEEKAREAENEPVTPPEPSPRVEVDAKEPVVKPTPTAPPPREGRRLTVPAIVSFAVAGVGLTAFGTFGLLALSEQATIEEGCGGGVVPRCSESDVKRMDRFALAADIGLGVAVVGATAGLLFWLFSKRPLEERPSAVAGLQLWGSSTGLGAGWAGELR